jgi:hypothetical protein
MNDLRAKLFSLVFLLPQVLTLAPTSNAAVLAVESAHTAAG